MADKGYSPIIVEVLKEADKRATEAAEKGGRKAGRMVMLNALRALSDTLVEGSADCRAIALEHMVRTLERPLPRPDLPDPLKWEGYGP